MRRDGDRGSRGTPSCASGPSSCLLGHGEQGVQVRVIGAREVYKLLGGRGWDATEGEEADARASLHAPPYALAAFAAEVVGTLSPETPVADRSRFSSEAGPALSEQPKTGACELLWEDEAEALVQRWLGEKLETRCAGMGKGASKGKGGRGRSERAREKADRLRGSFRARTDSDRRRLVKVLRHEAPLLGQDGWVSLRDVSNFVGAITSDDAAAI